MLAAVELTSNWWTLTKIYAGGEIRSQDWTAFSGVIDKDIIISLAERDKPLCIGGGKLVI